MMDSKTRILDIAEQQMRQRGYNAVSYRDIAAEMGIKSASLHYHFPKKSDLGRALVARYRETIYKSLASKGDSLPPETRLSGFIDIYGQALTERNLLCLCVVFGAEIVSLPEDVVAEVNLFFEQAISYLDVLYKEMGHASPQAQAQATFSALNGALIVAFVHRDISVFDATVAMILRAG